MKLDHDCVRGLLLALENSLQFGESFERPEISFEEICSSSFLADYSKESIAYVTLKLDEAGFVDVHIIESDWGFHGARYFSITFLGHNYLDNIRNDDVWSKIKEKIKTAGGSVGISLIASLADQYARMQLGL